MNNDPHFAQTPTTYYTEQEAHGLALYRLLGYALGVLLVLLMLPALDQLEPTPAPTATAGVYRPYGFTADTK